uniref:TehB/YeaR-like domain-containing protein n=1 Tax=Amphilophus citrinellus TaxID=61819 RepID=A0A3Q0RUP5_AMPCI
MHQKIRNMQLVKYARDLARSLLLSQEQARVEATASYNDALPNGLATPNHRLVCARVSGSAENIAIVWYSIKQRTFGKQLFVYDFEVDTAWRGKGYGEKILSAVLDAGRAAGAEYAELSQPPFIEPQQWHRIVSFSDDMTCQLAFYCSP